MILETDVRGRVLEIGCGWGSFAIEAARQTGCRVTAITLSAEQLSLARERVRRAGVEDRVAVEQLDYRHVSGEYDKVVSIEMVEAVGHANLELFFAVCDGRLRPGGRAVVQVITIPDDRYREYLRSSDWIRKHIFPGGHLPSLGFLRRAWERGSSLRMADAEDIGPHYAATLAHWRRRLLDNADRVSELGFDEDFLRKWEYYFAYCEAGFATGVLHNFQIVLDKPGTVQR